MSYYRHLIQEETGFSNLVVAAYKFEGNGDDSHINAYNGTVGSSVTFSTTNAVDGLAGQFINNTNSRIVIADNNAFSFTNGLTDTPFSIKANIRTASTTLTQPIFSKYTGSNNNTSEYLFFTRGVTGGRLAILLFNKIIGGGFIGVETTTSVANGLVNNVIVTYDGSGTVAGIQMFINGVLQSLNNISSGAYVGMGNTTVTPIIGNRSGNTPFVGTIDELYIFNVVLNPAQIDTLQTNFYPNF
jgi:hypothetical protein